MPDYELIGHSNREIRQSPATQTAKDLPQILFVNPFKEFFIAVRFRIVRFDGRRSLGNGLQDGYRLIPALVRDGGNAGVVPDPEVTIIMAADVQEDEFSLRFHGDKTIAVHQVVLYAVFDSRITVAREAAGLPQSMHALGDQAINDGFGVVGGDGCAPSGLAECIQALVEVGVAMNGKDHLSGRCNLPKRGFS